MRNRKNLGYLARPKNLIFIVSAIFLVIVIASSLYFSKLNSVDNEVVINITSSGFSPKSIKVLPNTKITFVNKNTSQHWIASDNHPTHELHPELDTKQTLNPNQSWSISFQNPGEYPFHDHLNPQLTGLITIVGNSNNQTNSSLTSFDKVSLIQDIKKMAKDKGSLNTWKFFKEKYQISPPNGSHDIAHYLGSEIYKELGLSALKNCDFSFAFGCHHGVLEEYIAENGVNNLNPVVQLCSELESQEEITCYHGLGHGILPYFKYELSPSLKICDQSLPEQFKIFCHNGVFMENALVNSSKLSEQNPLWPCTEVDEHYKTTCFGYQMVLLGDLYKKDVKKIAATCEQTGKKDYVISCIRGLASMITQSKNNVEEVHKQCTLIENEENRNICIITAAESWVFERKPIQDAENGLCARVPKPWSDQCLQKVAVQKSLL